MSRVLSGAWWEERGQGHTLHLAAVGVSSQAGQDRGAEKLIAQEHSSPSDGQKVEDGHVRVLVLGILGPEF